MPSFQNPVGAVSGPRRASARSPRSPKTRRGHRRGRHARRPRRRRPPPPIGAFARAGTVVTIGSLSKLIWEDSAWGGFARRRTSSTPPGLKVMNDLGNSPRIAGNRRPADAAAPSIRERRRLEVGQRRETLESELSRRLPNGNGRRGRGLSLWVRLRARKRGRIRRHRGAPRWRFCRIDLLSDQWIGRIPAPALLPVAGRDPRRCAPARPRLVGVRARTFARQRRQPARRRLRDDGGV